MKIVLLTMSELVDQIASVQEEYSREDTAIDAEGVVNSINSMISEYIDSHEDIFDIISAINELKDQEDLSNLDRLFIKILEFIFSQYLEGCELDYQNKAVFNPMVLNVLGDVAYTSGK